MPNGVRLRYTGFWGAILVALAPIGLPAQTGTVTGRVSSDRADAPIPAAQVGIALLNISTLTGADGSFTLSGVRPGRYQLQVVRIGYRASSAAIEVVAGETARAALRMTEAPLSLDEVVVTGTVGQARRREVGNSIAQVNTVDIKQPVQTLETMLQGRTPGIVIPTGRADMGSGQAIRLRGNASLSLVNYPLIYIDGIRQTDAGYSGTRSGGQSSLLADIDPATIDRVEIVKGPAATALYGTEAASGVIQIFTKRGVPGRTTWTFQTDQGVRWVRPWGSQPGFYAAGLRDTILTVVGATVVRTPRAQPLAGTATRPCVELADSAAMAEGRATGLAISGCHRPYHDMDRYLQKPHRQRYTLSAAGGSDLIRFFTSASGEGGNGILPNDEDLRYQFRSNVSVRPSNKLTMDVSAAYSRYRFSNSGYGNNIDGLYFQVVRRPLNNVASYNYAVLDSVLMYDINQRNDRMILGTTATWTPLRGMSHKLTIGYDDARAEEKFVHPLNYITDRPGRIGLQNTWSRSLSTDYVVSQQLSLFSGLSATLSGGGQLVQRDQGEVQLQGTGLPTPGVHTVSSANTQLAPDVNESRVITGGFLFQNMFAFKDRYFLTAGVRIDGNSAFGKDLGLQTYPKASASYVISEEPFWPSALGTMKLRAAYGWAGRAPGAFDATRTWTPLLFTGAGGTALIPRQPGNDSLGPERSRELEVGLDAAVLGQRLSMDVTWYHRVTEDALLGVSLPASLGNTSQQFYNVGEFENKGLEIGATGTILDGADFGFEIQATLATNASKVLQVGPARLNDVVVGQPAPVVRSLKVLNAFAYEDPVFEHDTLGFYGPNLPTHTFTVAPTVRLPRGITVTARGEYQGGAWINQGAAHFLAQRGPYGTPSCDEVYRLVPWDEYHGPASVYPASRVTDHPNIGQVNAIDRARCYRSVIAGTLFKWPADFFKVREITLQSPVPFRIPRMQSAIVTLSIRNIFTILPAKNRSQDPDVGGSVEGLTFNFLDAIPAPAEFTLSLRTTF